jgi:MFS transporter, FSR family, fosmidomycin resistance protein
MFSSMHLQSARSRLIVLTITHAVVDFYAGLIVPLVEPTLTTHFGVSLTTISLLVGGSAFVINLVQPLGGALLPRRGMPILLLIAPPVAALMATIGLTHSVLMGAVLMVVSGAAIGIVHPEATLTASAVSRRREGLGVGFFLAGGYLGFSAGSLLSGVWVERAGIEALGSFWILMLPALAISGLVALTGLHRYYPHDHKSAGQPSADATLPFPLTLMLAVGAASVNLVLIRLVTILLVRQFPGQDAQAWGGTTVFALGLTGAIGAFGWGYVSGYTGHARLIAILVVLGAPFYWLLLHSSSPPVAALWGALTGLTIGSTFSLSVVLARRSKGTAHRLRIGLAIGGAWGSGEVLFMVAGRFIDAHAAGAVEPVRTVLSAGWLVLAALLVLAFIVDRRERGGDTANPGTAP